ncbi:MAG: hypothetical protein KGS72_08415 [Cyanobacteria bacterium REEB67]|nr:hypothetical protein [Cyanobacteria bacterium REEB67]
MLIDSSTGKHRSRPCPLRGETGSQLAEFGPALFILAFFILIPLLDLGILPIRWMLAQEIVNEYSRNLALQENFSQSFKTMEADPSLATRLKKLGGVTVETINLRLRASRVFRQPHAPEFILVNEPKCMPPAWQPDGAKAPCAYGLELNVQSLMAPAFLFPISWYSIPGLTKPIPVSFNATHEWENLGRNPVTKSFFLNE